MADSIRIVCDVAFPLDERGEMSEECKAAHDALLCALASARKVAADVAPHEDTRRATRHVCRHADGLPCVEEEEVDDASACVAGARASVAAAGVERVKP